MPASYRDRTDAGERLADALLERRVDADLVVAIPRGGLPLGRAVADALDAPLDVVVARKLGAPGNPEYAVGAVASDGSVWRNEHALAAGVSEAYFERERRDGAAAAREKAERYRGDRPPLEVAGQTVVLVDDGVATGSTMRACIQQLQNGGADRIVVAVPVGPPDTIADLERSVDDVVCPLTPLGFAAVGQFYDRFDQVSDEEALQYLAAR